MNARTSRSAKAGQASTDNHGEQAGQEPNLAFDDLLDARFDEQGRLSQVGRGSRQRIAERLDPRPPAASAEDLERAVKQLAEGLEAIERQSRPQTQARVIPPEPGGRSAEPGAATGSGRDFVTYSLDRLEARLEALSQRLQSRAAPSGDARREASASTAQPRSEDPSLAVEPGYAAGSFELRLTTEEEAARAHTEAEAAEAERQAAEASAQAEARRLAEEAAEAERIAAVQAAEEERSAAEAESRRQAEAMRLAEEQAAEARWQAEQEAAEARRRAEEAEAEARRQAQAAEEERLARLAHQRQEAEAAASVQRQFAEIEARLEALQRASDDNQIAPVREELMRLIGEIADIGRDRGNIAETLEAIGVRLGEMEVKVHSARNMAGNRLGDIQDRIAGLTDRLDGIEVEVPGFDAVRENQGAILERFDRMEGLVNHIASPGELIDRVDALRRQLQTTASHEEAARIQERILELAERLDALPETLSDAAALERIEDQLATLASELAGARQQRMEAAGDLDRRLSDISSQLSEVGESGRTPDLSGVEERLAELGRRFDEDRHANGDGLSRLEQRLAALANVIEEQEDGAAAEILAALTSKIDALAEAIDAQDTRGARRDIEALDGKLDQVAGQLSEHAEHLSRAQVQPLETRLDHMQEQLEQLAQLTRHAQKSTSDQIGPFVRQLQEIADRVSALDSSEAYRPISRRLEAIEDRLAGLSIGKGPDTRALQTQLEGIVSRLELLKGRSIDPARLSELFDRAEAAVRSLPEERFDRLERKFAESAIPPERFDRLERSIATGGSEGLGEQLARLERRLEEGAAGGMSEDDVARLERRLAASAKELFGAAQTSDAAEERFARLERQLEQIGLAYSADGDLLSPEDLGELRGDIIALRRELRSLPGLGDGEGNLGAVLKNIAERMERLPEDPPASAAALEAQVERIAQILDDPSHSRLALAHIETSLKSIEERLEETRRSIAYRPARDGDEPSGGDVEAVAGMARSLSDDVTVLRDSAEASEKKTKDALDAVQETLEAVVRRMAFLERDAEASAERERQAAAQRDVTGRSPDLTVETAAGEPAEAKAKAPSSIKAPVAPETGGKAGNRETEAADVLAVPPVFPGLAADEDTESSQAETEAEAPRAGGGLLSRLTSRQLLKRATGGRAESFTPEPDENEDEQDFPLEPGTDSPLSSALAGAPSSDTEFMTGARSKSRLAARLDPIDEKDTGSSQPGEASSVDEDFLTAARRAARAAAAEAEGTESGAASGRGGLAGIVKSRRGALMAAALAVAVAFAALQIIRNQMSPGENDVAVMPDRPAPVAATPDAGTGLAGVPATPESMQAEAPASVPPASVRPGPTDVTDRSGIGSGKNGSDDGAGVSASDTASAPPAEPTPGTSGNDEVAALDPTSGETAETTPAAEPAEPELPVTIGSERLREAALAGDTAALFEVASRYAEGRGVLLDMGTAVEWYERAAEAGSAPAQYRLGSVYEKGLGVPKDLGRAQDWYGRAAEAGNVKAMHNLAVLHAEGAGGEPDLERASELFRQAAERGVRDSQFNLAVLHARGLGVPRDLIEAYKWFSIAASSGDEESASRRDIIAAALSESDLAKAQAAAASFEPLPLVLDANEVRMPTGGWGDTQDSTSVEVQPAEDGGQTGSTLSENDLVALVQKLLTGQGYDPGPADGLLGNRTIQAIVDFQSRAGLQPTGQIDSDLVEALQASPG